MKKRPKMIEKTDGSGNTILVPDPDFYAEEKYLKRRKRVTNFTPKKKKRK